MAYETDIERIQRLNAESDAFRQRAARNSASSDHWEHLQDRKVHYGWDDLIPPNSQKGSLMVPPDSWTPAKQRRQWNSWIYRIGRLGKRLHPALRLGGEVLLYLIQNPTYVGNWTVTTTCAGNPEDFVPLTNATGACILGALYDDGDVPHGITQVGTSYEYHSSKDNGPALGFDHRLIPSKKYEFDDGVNYGALDYQTQVLPQYYTVSTVLPAQTGLLSPRMQEKMSRQAYYFQADPMLQPILRSSPAVAPPYRAQTLDIRVTEFDDTPHHQTISPRRRPLVNRHAIKARQVSIVPPRTGTVSAVQTAYATAPSARGRPLIVDHRRSPPAKGDRQGKYKSTKLASAYMQIMGKYGASTEANDFLEVAYWSLPENIRERIRKGGDDWRLSKEGRWYRVPTTEQMLWGLYTYHKYIDPDLWMQNFMKNAAQDWSIGKLKRVLKEMKLYDYDRAAHRYSREGDRIEAHKLRKALQKRVDIYAPGDRARSVKPSNRTPNRWGDYDEDEK